jgi:hypothetical protein
VVKGARAGCGRDCGDVAVGVVCIGISSSHSARQRQRAEHGVRRRGVHAPQCIGKSKHQVRLGWVESVPSSHHAARPERTPLRIAVERHESATSGACLHVADAPCEYDAERESDSHLARVETQRAEYLYPWVPRGVSRPGLYRHSERAQDAQRSCTSSLALACVTYVAAAAAPQPCTQQHSTAQRLRLPRCARRPR